MEPTAERLSMYGAISDADQLDWSWVRDQLVAAGTYWVAAGGSGHPHPRPVWGIWHDDGLHLSVGSQVLARQLAQQPPVTVHLDSGVDVVIVEALVSGPAAGADLIASYNQKYSWDYQVSEYGPLTTLTPSTILAWRSAGWAGRDGFQATGRWRFGPERV